MKLLRVQGAVNLSSRALSHTSVLLVGGKKVEEDLL